MTKTVVAKNYLFIDTDVFINTITGNTSKDILKILKSKLNDNKIVLVLPKVIIKEIEKEFENWKTDLFKKTKDNLTVKKILGIKEPLTDSNPKQNNSSELLNIELINDLIKTKKDDLLSEIESFYKGLSTELNSIFSHKNTKVVELTNKIVLSGIKRSLLKKAPCTRSDKTKENAHTKDIDCIAFESLLFFLKKEKINKIKNKLFLCVKDSDYRQLDRTLSTDISTDLQGYFLKDFETIESMLDDFLGVNKQTSKIKESVLTLDTPTSVIEGSQIIIDQNL